MKNASAGHEERTSEHLLPAKTGRGNPRVIFGMIRVDDGCAGENAAATALADSLV